MSMINDALRRASSAAKSSSGGTLPPQLLPSVAAPMSGSESGLSNPSPPVLDAAAPPPIYAGSNGTTTAPPVMRVEPTQKKSSWPIIIIVLLVFCLAGAAAAYLWQKSRKVMVQAVEKSEDELRLLPLIGERPSNATSVTQSDVPKPTTNASTGIGLPIRTPAVGANQVVGPAVTSAIPAAPVKFPPLRLQSIFYRPANPSVIINNKTLFVADEISGVKVADIQAASVTLVLSGQTNILTLR
jgi:hypothetical protein